jgi:S-formylglutathione hydrolase FrmB
MLALGLAFAVIASGWEAPIALEGTIDGRAGKSPLHVYLPKGYDAAKAYPLLIVLHGWDHSPELFRKKSDLAGLADAHGFVLAVPQMGRSIYETKFYAETKSPWTVAPGTRWVGEVVLPYVRAHYPVEKLAGVIGYSTGGRGAVLVAEAYPQDFVFAGSLSGTFDLMRLDPKDGEYKIHAVMYGARDAFEARWKLDNCVEPARLEKLGAIRVYAAHGADDKVVNPNQLQALRDALPAAEIELVPGFGHDWKFWNARWSKTFELAAKTMKLSAKP